MNCRFESQQAALFKVIDIPPGCKTAMLVEPSDGRFYRFTGKERCVTRPTVSDDRWQPLDDD